MPLLAANKDIATVEVTPHHLTLVAPDAYRRLGTLAQMNPPVRDAAHQRSPVAGRRAPAWSMCWAPTTRRTRREEKAKPYPQSPSGMPGVQTLVPVMLDHVSTGPPHASSASSISPAMARPASSASPARAASPKAMMPIFTVVDLKRRRTITNDWIESRCGWTPYDGMR